MTKVAPRKIARYGWKPDLPDLNDLRFAPDDDVVLQPLPAKVDLRDSGFMPSIYDQFKIGSCTANSTGAAVEFDLRKQGAQPFMPSRLFIYYNERVIEGTVGEDAGAQLRDGLKTLHHDGVPPEQFWGYDETKFAMQPPAEVYAEAEKHQITSYKRVSRDVVQFKACLAMGYPFVGGFTVYESFEGNEVANSGLMAMPRHGESVLGGHAVLFVGYDDERSVWIVRNSWGPNWGDKGYFYMPQQFLLEPALSADFWTVRAVEAA